MFTEDLKPPMLTIGADYPDWGGPACVKLAMMMYPGPACPMFTQKQIAQFMATHVKEPATWVADPYAVARALNGLCPPPNGTWYDISGPSDDEVLWTSLRWMTKYKYPPLLCLPEADHWIAVTYYQSWDDPTTVKNPVLEAIKYYEPSVYSGTTYVPGWMWKSATHWGAPCPAGSMWKGKWIAVAEPPDDEGTFQIEEVSRTGTKLIEPDEARAVASEFMANSDAGSDRVSYPDPRPPLLTTELADREKPDTDEVIRYYVVPFGHPDHVDDGGALLSSSAVMVNAATSMVEGMKEFLLPQRYLEEAAVRRIAASALRLSDRESDAISIESVAVPASKLAPSANPAWQVTFDRRTFYITHAGDVIATLNRPTLLGR